MRMVEICTSEMPMIELNKIDITPELILNEACSVFKLKKEDVISKQRKTELVFCRFIVCHICVHYLRCKQADVAALLGFDDHSSVIHCLKRVRGYLSIKDPLFTLAWDKNVNASIIWITVNQKYKIYNNEKENTCKKKVQQKKP